MSLPETLASNFTRNNYRGINMKPKSKEQRDARQESLDRYKEALQLDKNDLDTALEQQPTLLDEVAEEHALAVSRRDEMKTAMEEAYATQADNIRNSSKPGEKPPTDSSVKEQASLTKEYLDAVAAYQEAKTYADLLGVKVESFRERGRSMGKLTELYVANYWARSSAGAKTRDMGSAKANDAKEAMRETRSSKPFSLKRTPHHN